MADREITRCAYLLNMAWNSPTHELGSVDPIEPDADSGAVEDEADHRRFGERTSIQGIDPRGRGGIIVDGGRPCRGGNRRTHRQILAAAKGHCPRRTARVPEPG